jgi:hypothetical protein
MFSMARARYNGEKIDPCLSLSRSVQDYDDWIGFFNIDAIEVVVDGKIQSYSVKFCCTN